MKSRQNLVELSCDIDIMTIKIEEENLEERDRIVTYTYKKGKNKIIKWE